MQAPAWISGFVGWRWMPSVALVGGSLVFVALAVLVVPDDFGSVAGGSPQLSRSRSRLAANAEPTKESSFELPSLKSFLPGRSNETPEPTPQVDTPVSDEKNVVQSIFHSAPPIELPVAPPDPNPEPPPPEPPPPAPTATIFTLPTPPEPQPLPAEAPPAPEVPGAAPPQAPAGITPDVAPGVPQPAP